MSFDSQVPQSQASAPLASAPLWSGGSRGPRVRAKGGAPSRTRVLLIEEDPASLTALRGMLGHGASVIGASSAALALEVLQSATPPGFGVIVCDLALTGTSGIQVYEAIVGIDPLLARRLVFLSENRMTTATRAFLDTIPNLVVRKPCDPQQLRAAVQLVEAEMA